MGREAGARPTGCEEKEDRLHFLKADGIPQSHI